MAGFCGERRCSTEGGGGGGGDCGSGKRSKQAVDWESRSHVSGGQDCLNGQTELTPSYSFFFPNFDLI